MSKILDEILKKLPADAEISEACFEGANIVLYTKNKEFFLDNQGVIKDIVESIKKRVELRVDPPLTLPEKKTREIIEELTTKEANVTNITFDPKRSRLIIEAEKPGLVIGKSGELLKEIKKKTLWTPLVKRTPAIKSILMENIRQLLYDESDYRRKFLNNVGKRIYNGWVRGKKDDWVRVSFLGGAREVGRSCLFLQTSESRILLDCGVNMAVSSDEGRFPILEAPEFNLQELDAIILTHAHLDHMGAIPYLFKMGYRNPVYCTAPVRDIAALLALDYIGVSQKEAKNAIYSSTDVKEMVKHTICLDYEEVSDITPDVRLTLYNAGHALGSAMAHLHIGNGLHNTLYTGDYNYETSNLLAPAATRFPRLESVIMEGTYGSKNDITPSRSDCEQELVKIIKETVAKNGKILMPVLGVGRSQEVMLILEKVISEGILDKIPIFLHGLLWDVTAIHTAYPTFFNRQVKTTIFQKDQNPFLSEIFKRVGSRKELMEVVEEKGPCIIMATSGMLTGGSSVEYFKELADNQRNSLVLTSYQGEGSLGRKLENGEREIVISEGIRGETVNVKMDVHSIKGFSGHSNFKQLCNFVQRLEPRPKKIIVVHGEYSKCLELASILHQMNKMETSAPKNLEAIRLR